MQRRGMEVQAISSPGELLDEFARAEGITAHAIPIHRRISPLRDIPALVRLWRCFRQTQPDIVHSQTPKGGILGMAAAWLAGVPVRVYSILGLPFMTATGTRRYLLRLSEQVSCALAHQVLCVSHSMKELATTERICSPTKLIVLLNGSINGIDAASELNPETIDKGSILHTRQSLGIPDQATVIGFVGRIVRDKGIIELASAWRTLRDEYPDLHLVMVGPIEPQDPIPAEVETQLREDPRVHLTGFVESQLPFYGMIDIVILPTYREGFPVVPLEAAAMGLPVVATAVPGCMEAVSDGVTGTLVPPRDPAALADAIRTYLTNPSLAHQHGQAGRNRVLADFQQEPLWEAIYQMYASLLIQSELPSPAQSLK